MSLLTVFVVVLTGFDLLSVGMHIFSSCCYFLLKSVSMYIDEPMVIKVDISVSVSCVLPK